MAPHSSTRAQKNPMDGPPGRLQSMGSQRVGHDWATSLSKNAREKGPDNTADSQLKALENHIRLRLTKDTHGLCSLKVQSHFLCLEEKRSVLSRRSHHLGLWQLYIFTLPYSNKLLNTAKYLTMWPNRRKRQQKQIHRWSRYCS